MPWPTDDDEFYISGGSDGAARERDLEQEHEDRAREKEDRPPVVVRTYSAHCVACLKPFAVFTAGNTPSDGCPFCGSSRVRFEVVSPAGFPPRPASPVEVQHPNPVSGRRARTHRRSTRPQGPHDW